MRVSLTCWVNFSEGFDGRHILLNDVTCSSTYSTKQQQLQTVAHCIDPMQDGVS